MKKYGNIVLIIVIILTFGSLSVMNGVNIISDFQSDGLFALQGTPPIVRDDPISTPVVPNAENVLSSSKEELNKGDFKPKFTVKQQTTVLLNQTFDEIDKSYEFASDIWGDLLGSDLYNRSLYTTGFLDTSINAGDGSSASLFARIGNYGNNSFVDEALVDDIANISAGWKIDFPITDIYSMINISFKWRFDTPDGGFDNYDEIILPDGTTIPMDVTPDYQEIRCRVEHPDISDSFWVGNAIDETANPNGTVYYRIGANVTGDELWNSFEYSFKVDSQVSNFTLELGAYLNTRENSNEFFDVWFDDVLILGINDIPDTNPPQPVATGLERTTDIEEFDFWANFSEGTWETPIKNVTVFYNQTTTEYNNSYVSSLSFQPPSYINNAGYNQTRWEYRAAFNFSDNVTFYFGAYDFANNSFVSEVQSIMIGDYSSPEILSTVIDQTGTGTLIIRVNALDWGYGIDTIALNYTIDGEIQEPMFISGGGLTEYQANFTLDMSQDYGSTVEFGVFLNDTTAGNSLFEPGGKYVSEYPIMAVADTVSPEIHNITVYADETIEEQTYVNVTASDPFGEISEVYLVVSYENGTIHEKYPHITLKNTTIPGVYELGKIAGVEALQLPFSETGENYSITVFVRDKASPVNEVNETSYYVVQDFIAPVVIPESIELEYTQPGSLRVWVQANDLGSGIKEVILERKSKDGWTKQYNMSLENGRYKIDIPTGVLGSERIEFRIYAIDNEGNVLEINRPTKVYTTKIFFVTPIGLLIMESIIVISFVVIFTGIKVTQLQQLKALRERRFEIALGRSERLAYLGEEAIFGFIAAYSQREGVSSILMWEPRLIGHFYQYLKELTDKANNSVAFIMQTKPQDHVTFVDFNIEKIGCTAHIFAYPVSTLPQQWLSTLTLDQVPLEGGQGTLLIMLIMREKWGEIANNFQEEITDGVIELKDLICSGEEKQTILEKAREFRLFISGTLEVLDEIETETDEVTEEIMGDFETEFLDVPDEDILQEEESEDNETLELSFEDDDT